MQCQAYIKSKPYKRCKRRQHGCVCYQHLDCVQSTITTKATTNKKLNFWRHYLEKNGLPAKMDPMRPWALLLDKNRTAIKGYPLGRGLATSEIAVWGSTRSTVWILEHELYDYVV